MKKQLLFLAAFLLISQIAAAASFRIVSFSIEPNSIMLGETGKATVTVTNNGSANPLARVELAITGQSGDSPSPLSISEVSANPQTINASETADFEFNFSAAAAWNVGTYTATARVFDSAGEQQERQTSQFVVSEKKTPVPEFETALLPLIAALVLAIVFLGKKKEK